MLRHMFKSAGKKITVLYVDSDINQVRTENLLKKLRYSKHYFIEAFAIVCSVENAMPVQVDKIFQEVKRIKQQYNIPVYGFVLDHCNPGNCLFYLPESYYMLSIADEIYSLPTTTFALKRNHYRLDWEKVYQQFGFQKFSVSSSPNLSGSYLDKWTSPDSQHKKNRKETDISQIMFSDAIAGRTQILKKRQKLLQQQPQPNSTNHQNIIFPSQQLPIPIIGQQAIDSGLIDGLGQHHTIIKAKHPDCHINIIKFLEDPIELKKAFILVTSPFLAMLFLFKVLLKWGFIVYFWVKGKKEKQKKARQKVQELMV